jgi:hypothetical protein
MSIVRKENYGMNLPVASYRVSEEKTSVLRNFLLYPAASCRE